MHKPSQEESRQVAFSDLFTKEQIARLETIYKESNGNVHSMTEVCKTWFFEPAMVKQLRKNGMLPGYAAYAIPFYFCRWKGKTT